MSTKNKITDIANSELLAYFNTNNQLPTNQTDICTVSNRILCKCNKHGVACNLRIATAAALSAISVTTYIHAVKLAGHDYSRLPGSLPSKPAKAPAKVPTLDSYPPGMQRQFLVDLSLEYIATLTNRRVFLAKLQAIVSQIEAHCRALPGETFNMNTVPALDDQSFVYYVTLPQRSLDSLKKKVGHSRPAQVWSYRYAKRLLALASTPEWMEKLFHTETPVDNKDVTGAPVGTSSEGPGFRGAVVGCSVAVCDLAFTPIRQS